MLNLQCFSGGIGSARKTSPPPIKQPQNLDDEDGYQSDSSVTRVANESLRLCDSLQERCLHVFNDEDSDGKEFSKVNSGVFCFKFLLGLECVGFGFW